MAEIFDEIVKTHSHFQPEMHYLGNDAQTLKEFQFHNGDGSFATFYPPLIQYSA